jgi:hypothetical protein
MTFCATNVIHQRANCGDQPDRSAAKTIRNRLPEQRRKSQYQDLDTGNVRGFCQGNAEAEREQFEGWNDARSGKGSHHFMEGNKKQIDVFLCISFSSLRSNM